MKRGEIWWADLDEPVGSAPGYRRPVIIIQADAFNKSKIQTIIVAVLTSNVQLSDMPGNIPLSKTESKLSKDCAINISQLMTIDKSILKKRVSMLEDRLVHVMDAGIKLVLDLRD